MKVAALPLSLAVLLLAFAPTVSARAQATSAAKPGGTTSSAAATRAMKNLPKTPRVPTTFEELFAERDARAQDALEYMRCFQGTVDALRAGRLGEVPRAWTITCVQQGKEWRGVFGELLDTRPGMRVHLQYALRGNGGTIVRDPVDTTRVASTARALLRGLSVTAPGAGKHEFLPVALPFKGFTELWFLPVPGTPNRVTTGGDSLVQMSVDGSRELGHSRTTPPIRTFAVQPVGRMWMLESKEERIPLLSELVVAHMALDMVEEVRVRTNQYESVLRRGVAGVRHVRR